MILWPPLQSSAEALLSSQTTHTSAACTHPAAQPFPPDDPLGCWRRAAAAGLTPAAAPLLSSLAETAGAADTSQRTARPSRSPRSPVLRPRGQHRARPEPAPGAAPGRPSSPAAPTVTTLAPGTAPRCPSSPAAPAVTTLAPGAAPRCPSLPAASAVTAPAAPRRARGLHV